MAKKRGKQTLDVTIYNTFEHYASPHIRPFERIHKPRRSNDERRKKQARALLFIEMLMVGNDKKRLAFISEASKILKVSNTKRIPRMNTHKKHEITPYI